MLLYMVVVKSWTAFVGPDFSCGKSTILGSGELKEHEKYKGEVNIFEHKVHEAKQQILYNFHF